MRVNDEVARTVSQTRKPGYLPSRFKPGYWINDTEDKLSGGYTTKATDRLLNLKANR